MRVLVTGGAGFIGSHLCSRLMAEGNEVSIVDSFNDFYDPELKRRNVDELLAAGDIRVHELDILDEKRLAAVFANTRPEAVVHLAAWAGVRPSLERPALYAQVNVTGTVNVLEAAKQHAVGCFIFGSSSSVYGANSNVPFSEADPIDRPVSPYAATKRAGELICHTYSYNFGMHITCLRFFTVYGPRQRPEMAIHKFARLIREGKEVPLFGDGRSRRDYTYIDDIISGITAVLKVNPRWEVLNLGESQTITLDELVRLLEEALGRKATIRRYPDQAGDMAITYADISRAREVIGYDPKTPVREGIRKFAEWFLHRGEAGSAE